MPTIEDQRESERDDGAREYMGLILSKENKELTVIPQNEARFKVKLHKAIEFLQRGKQEEAFSLQFAVLQKVLAEWVFGRDDLSAAYLTLSDGALCFVAMRKTAEYSADFDDELASLDYDISNDPDLDIIRLHTLSLPAISGGALEQFLDQRFVLQYQCQAKSTTSH